MATSKNSAAMNPDEQEFKRSGAKMLSEEDLLKLRTAMRERESSNNYMAVNEINYVGAYQMGAAALEDLGFLKKGSSKEGNKAVFNPENWTGKGNINSLEAFLKNEKVQDDAFNSYAQRNFKTLGKMGTIGASSSPEEVAGYLAASHLLGAGGASKSLDAKDKNNVTGRTYFNIAKEAINKPLPKDVKLTTDELVGVDTRGQPMAQPSVNTPTVETGTNITEPIGLPDLKNKEDIKRVQQAIGVKADGIWGPQSQQAWKETNDLFVTPTYREEGMQSVDTEESDLANPFFSVKRWFDSI